MGVVIKLGILPLSKMLFQPPLPQWKVRERPCGHEISLNDVIAIFEGISGRKLNVEYIEPQAGDVTKTGANTELLTRATSWRAKVLISEGIELQWNWAKSNESLFLK